MTNLRLLSVLAIAASFALVWTSSTTAAEKADDLYSFPSYAETEYEQSIITIPIYHGEGKQREAPVEILKLTAFMRLERETPTRNGLGHRQVEFTIADWELYGYSEFLDADVTFKLSDVPVQPKSLVISLTEESDYPAMIVYNAIYDIYIGQKLVAKNQPGVAFAKNVYEIPPRNISVAFTKPFQLPSQLLPGNKGLDAAIEVAEGRTPQAGEGSKRLPGDEICPYFFCDGTCEDMFQIGQVEFEEGLSISRAIRAGEYTLKKN